MNRRFGIFLVVLTFAAGMVSSQTPAPPAWRTGPETLVPGVEFSTSTDQSLVDPAGPISVSMLRLDPARARLTSLLSNDEVMDAEPVLEIALRHKVLAAVNAGFFNINNGEPVGLLKVAGELVSDTPIPKGAMAIWSPLRGKTSLAFDQVSARVEMRYTVRGRKWVVPLDGVDTTRARGKLMLFTPKYHADTDTATNGVEWVLRGRPLKVVETRRDAGKTPIPADGIVLSFGGLDVPESLSGLAVGTRVDLATIWTSLNGLAAKRLDAADHVVNGAGLLRVRGRALANWDAERLSGAAFVETRHPRTIVGVDRQGFIWLAVIDGRQPGYSVGMAFSDLQRLCDRLTLTDALNLDGGGSSTMVVKGKIVNRPSDANGPRAVSDAIGVTIR